MAKGKRVKLSEGDVFEMTLSDGRLGYGIIIKRGVMKSGLTPYIALYRSAYDKRPSIEALAGDDVALAGWSADALVYHGRWRVIAHDVPIPDLPFPNFKVETNSKFCVTDVDGNLIDEATEAELELLDYQFDRSPISYQRALEALHGLGEWLPSYEKLTPAYAKARITRRS